MFNAAEYALFNESLCHTEGQNGEVVVLLSTVAELVDVSLEGLDDVARRLRSVRRHQLEDAVLAILLLLAVLCLVETISVEQHHTAYGQGEIFAQKV